MARRTKASEMTGESDAHVEEEALDGDLDGHGCSLEACSECLSVSMGAQAVVEQVVDFELMKRSWHPARAVDSAAEGWLGLQTPPERSTLPAAPTSAASDAPTPPSRFVLFPAGVRCLDTARHYRRARRPGPARRRRTLWMDR